MEQCGGGIRYWRAFALMAAVFQQAQPISVTDRPRLGEGLRGAKGSKWGDSRPRRNLSADEWFVSKRGAN